MSQRERGHGGINDGAPVIRGCLHGHDRYRKTWHSHCLPFDQVAVKIINKVHAPHGYLRKFLPREIQTLTTVNHSRIVSVTGQAAVDRRGRDEGN